MAKKTTSKSTKSPSLNNLSMGELQAELARREKGVRKLERRREKLLAELTQIDTDLAAVGALSAAGGVRRRPRNEMNLVDSLAAVLEKRCR